MVHHRVKDGGNCEGSIINLFERLEDGYHFYKVKLIVFAKNSYRVFLAKM